MNAPVDGAMATVNRVISDVNNEFLPLPKEDSVKLIWLCINFNIFSFDNREHI